MKTSRCRCFWGLIFTLLCLPRIAFCSGVVNTATEAALRTALVGGGTVTFNCDGTIALSSPLVITNDSNLNASGHGVTISGGNLSQLFNVQPGTTLALQNLALADGLARGTNGVDGTGAQGGPGEGGAIYNNGGTIAATSCAFLRNDAQGGTGGAGSTFGLNGTGGTGSGGAIFMNNGYLNATNCTFAMNFSLGGTGALTTVGNVISTGGNAQGGGIYAQGSVIQFVNCQFSGNSAVAGQGLRFTVVGANQGGTACGGGICIATSQVSLVHCIMSSNSTVPATINTTCGGAIYQNGGSLWLGESLFASNTVLGGRGMTAFPATPVTAANAYGGALYIAAGSINITNCTLSGNFAVGGIATQSGYPGTGLGGAIYNSGTLQAVNCTIYDNTAQSGELGFWPGTTSGQGSGLGGGLCNFAGSMNLNCVTISGNSAQQRVGGTSGTGAALGGGLFSTNGTITLAGTILANSTSGSNCFGTLLDSGYNLSSDASAGFSAPGSLNNTDPILGALGNYGGPTPTIPLLAGSPAIDGGNTATAPATDQRGHARPYGAAADIGAFESSPPFFIGGQVSGHTLKDEVTIVIGAANLTTTNLGSYGASVFAAGPYTITPTSPNYLFIPASQPVTVGPDQFGFNFKAYHWNALSLEAVTNGTMDCIVADTNGQTCRVLTSTNLVQWLPFSTNAASSSNYFETFLPIANEPVRFYRTAIP